MVMGGWWVLAAPASHLLMRWGHKQTSGPSALRKSGMSLSEKCLLIYGQYCKNIQLRVNQR
ncbi:TPA: hypothetical protein HNC50_18455 [Escherichia coli]|nr:hypothetical protein [Escherichia coli]